MIPKIVTKPAFKTVGISYIGKNQSGEIPQMVEPFSIKIQGQWIN